jgi:hypothetical protein
MLLNKVRFELGDFKLIFSLIFGLGDFKFFFELEDLNPKLGDSVFFSLINFWADTSFFK